MTRLVVIGLDGGTDAVLDLADAPVPNIRRLRSGGASGILRSTVPPITAAAWPSMLTGWNPGRHGMFDFRVIDITRPSSSWGAGQSVGFTDGPSFVTSRSWAGSAVWDLAGSSCALMTIPMTYPCWPVDGVMVAGFPLPDYDRNHTYPEGAGDDMPPLLENGEDITELADGELAVQCQQLIERQAAVVRGWLSDGRHTLVMAVFQGTDFAQHRLWKYLAQPGHPLYDALLRMYGTVDEVVGLALDAAGDDGHVVVVSDHGFGPHPTTFVHTDQALADAGLLALRSGSHGPGSMTRIVGAAPMLRRRLRRLAHQLPERAGNWLAARYTNLNSIDWARTDAFRFPLYTPAEGVVVNLAGRQPHGRVSPGVEYEAVRDRVIASLSALRSPDGRPVVQWACRREELYSGELADLAPDVIALFHTEFKGHAGLGDVFTAVPQAILDRFSGVHAMDGVFAAHGPLVPPGVDLGACDIVDVAPTLLALLGVRPPADIDGRLMAGVLRGDEAGERDALEPTLICPPEEALTPEEEAALERSLRALGYLE